MSRSKWVAAAGALASLWLPACLPHRVSVHAAELRPGGRIDLLDPLGPRLAWSGSRLTLRFTGASIQLRGVDLPKVPDIKGRTWPNRLQITLDQGRPLDVFVQPVTGVLFEAEHLPDGTHTLEVLKQSEALVGEVQIQGIALGWSGRLLAVAPSPGPRLEFIGDSLSAGYGDEGADPSCPFSSATENFSLAYPSLTARALNADLVTVAWSGRGVTRNVSAPPGAETLPLLYDRALPGRRESRWDFEGWVPDVVVVNLGSNDFAEGVPDQQAFEATYGAFLQRLRALYPLARIVASLGPTLSDRWPPGAQHLTLARRYVRDVVDRLRQDGDARIGTFEFAPLRPEDGLGCDYHPSLKTHQAMALALAAHLRQLEGWQGAWAPPGRAR